MSLDVSFARRLETLLGTNLYGLHVCVAFSGGLDSSVLFHLLSQLAPRRRFHLSAVHVHHGISPDADAWAAHCERFAGLLDAPVEVRRVIVERDSADGLEAAARRARHAVFASLECDWIVLAHHRGDQAETVLHRLMRGSGVHGAVGMRMMDRSRRLLRPLLDEPRQALLDYARQHALTWIEDESNADTRFTRNFLRSEVLPLLRTRQAGVESNLARAAGLFGESAQLLDELAAEDAVRIAQGSAGSLTRLRQLSAARARNLLRYLLVEAGARAPATERLVEFLRQLREVDNGVRLMLDGHALCAWRDAFWLEPAIVPVTQPLVWRGEAFLDWCGGSLVFTASSGREALKLNPESRLRIRPRQGGERLRLHANGPSRAFKQLAQEAGVPPWRRAILPCLWQGDDLVWIARLGAHADWRCAEHEPGWVVDWHGNVMR